MARSDRLVRACAFAALLLAGTARADDAPTADVAPSIATQGDAGGEQAADVEGTLTLPNGDERAARYGEFDYTGIARFIWKSGRSYSGDFVGGHPHGHGIEQSPDGGTYDGGWVDGRHDGLGSMILPDGSRYDGGFVAGALLVKPFSVGRPAAQEGLT